MRTRHNGNDNWQAYGELVNGNRVLYRHDPDHYPPPESGDTGPRKVRRVIEHTVPRVLQALEANETSRMLVGPEDSLGRDLSWADGADVFVGYLMLDALVCNTDRHHENWALIDLLPSPEMMSVYLLAPSYDDGSSLGAELTEKAHAERLTSRDHNRTISAYVDRGRSEFFTDQGSRRGVPMIEAFEQALAIRPRAAERWLHRLDQCPPSIWQQVIQRIPDEHMTLAGRDFVDALLLETRRRLLDLK